MSKIILDEKKLAKLFAVNDVLSEKYGKHGSTSYEGFSAKALRLHFGLII
ncbi:MAG: hypothetical protein ACOYEG_05750 [Petrimonas sp.]|jgi:hypothetical protein